MVIRLLAGEEIDCSLRAARTMRHACLDETRFDARGRAGQRLQSSNEIVIVCKIQNYVRRQRIWRNFNLPTM
jgi:hypothetical protein